MQFFPDSPCVLEWAAFAMNQLVNPGSPAALPALLLRPTVDAASDPVAVPSFSAAVPAVVAALKKQIQVKPIRVPLCNFLDRMLSVHSEIN
jgi:hypothetical protein